ncbi:MAG: hypothetical protein A3J62_02140 [Candidatus Buchananbacteria bacterium RIFCSPHIGHO2_02_FULL_38_8]|uniref:Uncharacterized protein n=2 Tax=Candidatus Buchananiibacteriota TaxID=1817903 RepID=A0A1G1XXH4_9BACT|nr:MAG: hypothetical protein A2731_02575 [Candidatus Buchananbacteria bacterium RIFCSPHIGHO2_01_FULL_39_8]OGY47888.1 MAG: hypothetical protein A3J62_02140 [Candidatus Buchananbacteria bacterium RIFCSPHIGHO2_02_FULL_38_8]
MEVKNMAEDSLTTCGVRGRDGLCWVDHKPCSAKTGADVWKCFQERVKRKEEGDTHIDTSPPVTQGRESDAAHPTAKSTEKDEHQRKIEAMKKNIPWDKLRS